MTILKSLSSIFRKKPETPEVTLDTYAIFPVYQMMQNAAPFDDWKSPGSKIPSELEEIFKTCVWMYQMYVYYILTAQRFGYDIAEKVLGLQTTKLSTVSHELGQQLEKGVLQIHRSLESLSNEQLTVEANGENYKVPAEYKLALEFLTLGEDAPFHVDKTELDAGCLPDYKDADFALTLCLEHGKNVALSNFEPLIQVSKVVL
jgi:hypothetical protein